MKVNVVSRNLVKPSKPTPLHLLTYKTSLLDEINPSINHARVLYFSSYDGKFVCLEESLAQALSNFYPLAGRYDKEKHEVDCNDEGALYTTAEVDCELFQLIDAEVEPDQLNVLLPVNVAAVDERTDPMLAVQINRFRCGGLAIGVCASHRVIDSAAFGLFLTAWSKAAASGGGGLLIRPNFDFQSYFPAENLPPLVFESKKIVGTRCVFDKKAIQRLRERVSTEALSRVVAVSSFLTQAVLRADRAKHRKARAAVVGMLINVRERTIPPVSRDAFGTWISGSFLKLTAGESEAYAGEQNFPGMALKLKEATVKGIRDCARVLSDEELGRWALVDSFLEATKMADGGDCKVIWVTDFSKFGEYEADFGFGKPEWVSLSYPQQDHIILMNNKEGDGIEAWVYLEESFRPKCRRIVSAGFYRHRPTTRSQLMVPVTNSFSNTQYNLRLFPTRGIEC